MYSLIIDASKKECKGLTLNNIWKTFIAENNAIAISTAIDRIDFVIRLVKNREKISVSITLLSRLIYYIILYIYIYILG
jgi:hypothetical protein